MKSIRPDIIYIQHPAWARTALWPDAHGSPVAAAFAGRPRCQASEPAMPAELGLFFLTGWAPTVTRWPAGRDLPPRAHGEGQWIDASQWRERHLPDRRDDPRLAANERVFRASATARRTSRRRRMVAYRCAGQGPLDRHRCLPTPKWNALSLRRERGEWLDDRRFATLESRMQHQDALDASVEG